MINAFILGVLVGSIAAAFVAVFIFNRGAGPLTSEQQADVDREQQIW